MNRTWYREGKSLLKEIEETSPAKQSLAFWYLGQMGYIFKGDVTVYMDVMLNDHLAANGNSARWYQPPFPPEKVRTDYVFCTHNHVDHLAPETLQGIAAHDPDTRFVLPAGCASVLEDLGIAPDRILPVNAGQTLELPGVRISAVATAHPVYQADEQGRDLSLAFLLEMNGVRVLHPGDTYLTGQLIRELSALPAPDLFFPPINGQDYFRTERNCIGNLNTIEAARLSEILQADLTIPSHFDMFVGNTVDPLEFARCFMALRPSAKWHIPALGERFLYHK